MDIERLDSYLNSDQSPSNSMCLSDLDGFLTGILCSPELIMPTDWLPIVWRDDVQSPRNLDEHIWATQGIIERYNEIAQALNSDPSYIEPIFWQAPEGHAIAMDWCEGFGQSMQMQLPKWDELLTTPQGSKWIYPIHAHLYDENGISFSGVDEKDLDQVLDECVQEIPNVVAKIFKYWQSKRVS